jgi:hypothetical protein
MHISGDPIYHTGPVNQILAQIVKKKKLERGMGISTWKKKS